MMSAGVDYNIGVPVNGPIAPGPLQRTIQAIIYSWDSQVKAGCIANKNSRTGNCPGLSIGNIDRVGAEIWLQHRSIRTFWGN